MVLIWDELLPAGPCELGQSDDAVPGTRSVVDEMSCFVVWISEAGVFRSCQGRLRL
jgi:hypothetical protein